MAEILPIVKMQDDGSGASIISYNVPEPTTYFGNKYFEVDLEDLFQTNEKFKGQDFRKVFREFAESPFIGREDAIIKLRNAGDLKGYIEQIIQYGYNHKKVDNPSGLDLVAKVIYLPTNYEGLKKVERNIGNELWGCNKFAQQNDGAMMRMANNNSVFSFVNRTIDIRDSLVLHRFQKLTCIDSFDFIADKILEGNFLAITRNFFGQYDYRFIPIPIEITPKLFIIEKYKLSSFLGNYGAGKTVKTFSLLPGEKTKISVKTYKKTMIDSKRSSSILDSHTEESANDFETTLNHEQSNKQSHQDKLAWHVEAEAQASWGWGSAKISGGASGENASQREDMAKSVANAVEKHAQKASSKRDVQVNTSYEVKDETGEETSVVRDIENINVSRTLNFVFRQMNQQYVSLLHLIDAKIGYTSGLPGSFIEESIPKIDDLIKKILVDDTIAGDIIKEGIIDHLCFVIDYKGDVVPFLEKKHYEIQSPIDPNKVLSKDIIRTKTDMVSTYENVPSNLKKDVNGIIVSAQLNVMRTEGIFVEALLGQGDALDVYSHGLQDETVKEKQIANAKMELANTIISNSETEKAKLFEQVYPCCTNNLLGCDCNKNDKPQTK